MGHGHDHTDHDKSEPTDHDTAGHEGRSHGTAESGRSTRTLGLVAAMNFAGFVVELVGGLVFGSVALVSDAVHMLFDMLAYVMAFGASYTVERFEGGESWSYGLHRLEPVAAFLNGVLLVPMVGYILWESYQRFLAPIEMNAGLTLAVAAGGLLVNVASVVVLEGDDMSLNERGAFYHLLGDAGGSVAVIVATIAVAVFEIPIADPMAAVLIAVLVLYSAGTVLRESTGILLQRSPVSVGDLRTELETVSGVETVEDVHVWRVCSQLTVASVRVGTDAKTLDEARRIRSRLHDRLAEWGVDHSTVELIDRVRREGPVDPSGMSRHDQ